MVGGQTQSKGLTTDPGNLSEMTFRGLEIWDLGIMPRVGAREVGEIDWLGRAIDWNGLARACRHWRTGRQYGYKHLFDT